MGAEVALVQFRKLSGVPTVNEIVVDPVDVGYGFFFAGPASNGGQGYNLSPTDANASHFPVRGGAVSWEVWLAIKVSGAAFGLITNIELYVDSFDATNMGTMPDLGSGTYLVSAGIPLIPVSGIYMREVPGPIELGLDPVPLTGWVPHSAPAYGLPASEEGWLVYEEGPGTSQEAGDAGVDGGNPPEVLDLTPHNSSIPPDPNEVFGTGILVSDQEPRYSNVATVNLLVAFDASAGVRSPAIFSVAWNES